MTKETTLTIRVDADLRERFAMATAHADRPASQVLREFMRAYVDRMPIAPPAAPIVPPEERARREDAVRRGFANTELEGYVIPQATKDQARRYINGEITLAELMQA